MPYLREIKEQDLVPLLNGNTIDKKLLYMINRGLDKVGIYYRSFARIKSPSSLALKLNRKNEKYERERSKLQDIIGVRIVLYFEDDVVLCRKIIEKMFEVHSEDSQIDTLEISEFKPERLNLICTLPEEIAGIFVEKLWNSYRIDKTFELQIRTIFSEGWHEVEHDIRYKHEKEWKTKDYYSFNRKLNGIKATLEMCDNSIIHILDELTYYCYKNNSLEEMLRYKFRIHFNNENLSDELKEILDQNLRRELYKMGREEVLMCFANFLTDLPKTLDNLVFVCNELKIHNEKIGRMIPQIVKNNINSYINKIKGTE